MNTCLACGGASNWDFSGRDLMFQGLERYDYYSCINCGLVSLYPMLDKTEISGFYPDTYGVFTGSALKVMSHYKRSLLKCRKGYRHLRVPPLFSWLAHFRGGPDLYSIPDFVRDGHLLDVGCGNGRFLLSMRALGWNVQGIEPSDSGFAACHKQGLVVHQGDLLSAVLQSQSFDVITMRHVIEHVPNPREVLVRASDLLKPGGRLLIETPNARALGRAIFDKNWYANDVPRHLFLFSEQSLIKIASDIGLKVAQIKQESTPKIFLNSLDYALNLKLSKQKKWFRLFARIYIYAAEKLGRHDTLHIILEKS